MIPFVWYTKTPLTPYRTQVGGVGMGWGRGGMPLLDETVVASGVHVCIHCHSKLLGRDARGNFKINVIFD